MSASKIKKLLITAVTALAAVYVYRNYIQPRMPSLPLV